MPNDDSAWDRLPYPMKWVVGIVTAFYFTGGFMVPLIWLLTHGLDK